MRRVRYSVAMSLDGFLAGPQGEIDWLLMDLEIDFAALTAEFDTLLMGRKTYEAALQLGGGPGMPGTRSVVFSRTLPASDDPDVTISPDPRGTIALLQQQPGKDLWLFGGGDLFRSLLAAGLVDTVEVAVIPVLLGQGIPLLPGSEAYRRLKLTSHRIYKQTGTVFLVYDVLRDPGQSAQNTAGD